MSGEYMPLQFFGQSNPTREDALESLRLAVALLEHALPTALQHIGSEPIEDQYWFWYALTQFEEQNDLMDGQLEKVAERLSVFGQNIAELLRNAAGEDAP